MKKVLAGLLVMLLLCFSACTPAPAVETTAAPTTTEAPADLGIKNIILIIGDGMGVNQVDATQIINGEKFAFTQWNQTLVNTNSLDKNNEPTVTTDSAASATALATGVLTKNGYVGQDPNGTNLKTILDYAKEYGKATGVLTTDSTAGATPGGFSGHCADRNNSEAIVTSQLQSNVDLICSSYTAEVADRRSEIKSNGYEFCYTMSSAKKSIESERAFWLLNVADYNATDKLTDVTKMTLDFLSKDPDGFVLMIEQAHVDKHGHKNEFDGVVKCVNILNDTVETIMDWVGDREDTAILITADHETGALQISQEPEFVYSYDCADGSKLYYNFDSVNHSNSEVYLFTYGFEPDFEQYYTEERPTAIKNIDIFDMMMDILEDPLQEN